MHLSKEKCAHAYETNKCRSVWAGKTWKIKEQEILKSNNLIMILITEEPTRTALHCGGICGFQNEKKIEEPV